MPQVFVSHSSADDALVRRLQQALADLGEDLWIDSRELRGGGPYPPAADPAPRNRSNTGRSGSP